MWVAATPFVIYCATLYFAYLFGPEEPGFGWRGERLAGGEQAAWRLISIAPESAAARSGLRVDDLLLSWEGAAAGGQDLWGALLRSEVGRPYRLEIERFGQRQTVLLTLHRSSWRHWTRPFGLLRWLLILTSALWLALGFLVLWSRPDQIVARLGALCMAFPAVIFIRYSEVGLMLGLERIAALLPWPLWRFAQLAPILSGGAAISVLLVFLTLFPRRIAVRRWIWLVYSAPAAIFLPTTIYLEYFDSKPPALPFLLSLRVIFLLMAVYVLIWNYRGLTNPNHRRRVRLLAVGFGIALLVHIPILAVCSMATAKPEMWELYWRLLGSPIPIVLRIAGLAAPLCVAYAILKHRLFDIRVLIRQGLQYAVARKLLLAAAPVFVIILVLDAILHGGQPLQVILIDRGWLYLALAVGGIVAHRARNTWITALDRRFFRERYDAQTILHGVLEDIRNTGSMADMAERVVNRIEQALHPECVALLTNGVRYSEFQVIAQAPAASSPAPLETESKLVAMLRLLERPLEIPLTGPGDSWLGRQLPRQDTDYLRQARFEWLFPIAMGSGRAEGFLALGPKRSEEPYSREDQKLLATIATSLSLVLERPAVESITVVQSRLVDRYRLLRVLGRGGMGTVYEAEDIELDRRVAIKLMHADLTRSSDAVARFRREARVAAAFTHPNVVTVHDFGVDEGSGAFIVMELLQGVSLREQLQGTGRLPALRSVEILRGVTSAVEAAHKRSLIHRDLKPENVFLSMTHNLETPKVLDFGIVKTISSNGLTHDTASLLATGPGHLLGTPRYMSPEQLKGDEPSVSWDIWALAIIAYEMLVGAFPFPLASPDQWREAVQTGCPTPVRAHWPDGPTEADDLFRRAFATNPSDRPSSVQQLFDAIRYLWESREI